MIQVSIPRDEKGSRPCGKKLNIPLRFLGRPQQELADERLRLLRYQHSDGMRNVVGPEHLAGIFAHTPWAEVGVHRSRADESDPNRALAQLFCDPIGEPVQSPL